jgi:hypothetical protein
MTQPASIGADGNLLAKWVPSIANPLVPLATEINAGGSLDVSCYLTGSGLTPNTDEAVIPDPRLCSRQVFEAPGRITDTLMIGYVFNPASPADNLAYLTLIYLTLGFVVLRWGLPFETAVVGGSVQKVDVYPVKCGIQQKQPPEENSVLRVSQKLFVRGAVRRDVAVA